MCRGRGGLRGQWGGISVEKDKFGHSDLGQFSEIFLLNEVQPSVIQFYCNTNIPKVVLR